jgi:hypothetical protein
MHELASFGDGEDGRLEHMHRTIDEVMHGAPDCVGVSIAFRPQRR